MAEISKFLRLVADDVSASKYREAMLEAADTIERLQRDFNDDQECLGALEKERDEARAEVERLKARCEKQSDMIRRLVAKNSPILHEGNYCAGCGIQIVPDEMQFCMDCRE